MIPIPDWAPSLHPIVVHFPLALLVSAFIVDVCSYLLRGRGVAAATWLYVAGSVMLGAAFLSGRAGAELVMIPPGAEAIMTDHENWALRTLVFFGVLAVLRLVVLQLRRLRNRMLNAFLTLMGLVGVILLTITGDLGGNLVFGFGVGVTKAMPAVTSSANEVAVGGPIVGSEGFSWVPGREARHHLTDEFNDFDTGFGSNVLDLGTDSLLVIQAAPAPIMAVTKVPFGSIQVELEVNLDHFRGQFSVVYGASSLEVFDFLTLDGESMLQGKVTSAVAKSLDEKVVTSDGWRLLGAASDGHHFRGYLDGRLEVHGHDDPSESGGVGIRIDGQGIVLIRSIRVTPIR